MVHLIAHSSGRKRWPEVKIGIDSSAVVKDWEIGEKPGKTTPKGWEVPSGRYVCGWTWSGEYLYRYFCLTSVTTREHLLKVAGWPVLWMSNILPPFIVEEKIMHWRQ